MLSTNSNLTKWLTIIAFIFMVLVNGLAGSTTIIGGKDTAQISDKNPTLITPAGYVFSIWGVIYILLGIFIVFQALPKGRDYRKRIGSLFILSSLCNIVWLLLWQYEILHLSVVIMFLLLVTLVTIYRRLNIGKSLVSLRERFAVHLPFSVYLGWITIASIENVAVTLVSFSWNGFGVAPETWAILIIIIALLITLLVITTKKDLAYGLVIIWALLGVAIKQSGNNNIVTVANISAIIVAIAEAGAIFLSRLKHR